MSSGITTRVLPGDGRLELPTVELRVVEGADRQLSSRLGAAGMRIGTGATCDLKLSDATVSRLHCEVRRVGAAVRILDSGSTNGTFVDGVRVHVAELVPGARVRLGATVLGVVAADARDTVELSPRHRFGDVIGA